ncbi:PTS system, glucose-specific IIA component [Paenibacillus catalpae]|uniref:PTS system, glucose-specific IIA component n=1 Tax=Paenibacillus catalpae TaxID=1045775 RepID=A0A1I2BZP8_9BACL|nr:PTS glucose transporter subunit IIA [Paenibacillus catalpae]SFE61504.1 PTS system, glucose-specific IIA component [Paenibacillus catalpae]
MKWFGKKTNSVSVAAPLSGKLVPLSEVPDEAFAQGLMGDGVAIEPTEGRVIAPFDGVVSHLIDTHHALIIEHSSGLQLLIHVGINTVALNGDGFKALVNTGDSFKAGQTLLECDLDKIRSAGYPVITPVIVANEDGAEKVECTFTTVQAGDPDTIKVIMKT